MEDFYLSKTDIATILKTQISLMAHSMKYPDKSFKTIITEHNPDLPKTDINEYYTIMQELFSAFLVRKYFTTYYDITFKDYLKEDDIPDSLVNKNIFVGDSNADDFSKTETINFIRNAICHNDTTEYCRFLVRNGKLNLEIDR